MRVRDINKENLVKKKAVDLLVKDGFDGFSMQKLAKACNISVATLYIYYKHKEDLIQQIGLEEGKRMTDETMKDFSPEMNFAEGLKKQWENRSRYALANPRAASCLEVIRHSPYGDTITNAIASNFKPIMHKFVEKAIKDKQLKPMPIEVYWSIAFGPVY
ncbi:MAG: TetR/AcrR family transcriptional regulator, partial [Bacteroidetes bacterium]|nr:TetR/AcrR family transcriptional regulator [Bacteroidota bacterium]